MDWTDVRSWLAIIISVVSPVVVGLVARNRERKFRQPILWPVLAVEHDQATGDFTCTLDVTNSGADPAENVEVDVIFAMDIDLGPPQLLFGPELKFSGANTLPPGETCHHEWKERWSQLGRRWIWLRVACKDGFTGEPFSKRYGYAWFPDEGRVAPLSPGQVSKLDSYVQNELPRRKKEFDDQNPPKLLGMRNDLR